MGHPTLSGMSRRLLTSHWSAGWGEEMLGEMVGGLVHSAYFKPSDTGSCKLGLFIVDRVAGPFCKVSDNKYFRVLCILWSLWQLLSLPLWHESHHE